VGICGYLRCDGGKARIPANGCDRRLKRRPISAALVPERCLLPGLPGRPAAARAAGAGTLRSLAAIWGLQIKTSRGQTGGSIPRRRRFREDGARWSGRIGRGVSPHPVNHTVSSPSGNACRQGLIPTLKTIRTIDVSPVGSDHQIAGQPSAPHNRALGIRRGRGRPRFLVAPHRTRLNLFTFCHESSTTGRIATLTTCFSGLRGRSGASRR
jgi:hypothetical protein